MDDNKELLEAVNAAYDALYHLEETQKILKSAGNWGLFDIFGGGLIASIVKRDKMRDAQQEMRKSEEALYRLNKELGDVNRTLNLSIEMDGFNDFADIIFDNFFSDLFTQEKISKAKSQVQEAIDDVEDVLDVLEAELERQS